MFHNDEIKGVSVKNPVSVAPPSGAKNRNTIKNTWLIRNRLWFVKMSHLVTMSTVLSRGITVRSKIVTVRPALWKWKQDFLEWKQVDLGSSHEVFPKKWFNNRDHVVKIQIIIKASYFWCLKTWRVCFRWLEPSVFG